MNESERKERINRLPQWVQKYISELEARVEDNASYWRKRAGIVEGTEPSRLYAKVGADGAVINLPDDAGVVFTTDKGEIEFRFPFHQGVLYHSVTAHDNSFTTRRQIVMFPKVSNEFAISTVEREYLEDWKKPV